MSVEIKIEGIEKVTAVAELCLTRRKAINMRVKQEMDMLGQRLVRTSKKDYLSGPRSNFLGVVTGRLRRSILYVIDEPSDGQFELRFGSDVIYARIHEYGGPVKRGGKTIFTMKDRPFLRPSWDREVPSFKERIPAMLEELAGRLC